MKKIILLIILSFQLSQSEAQRFFFYVENDNMAERPLKEDLLKASQFVAKSQIMSDYIIKAEAEFKSGSIPTTFKIMVEDSASFQPIFETSEEYAFGTIRVNSRILINVAMKTLIEKNMDQILLCAKNNHRNTQTKWVLAKKDKT